MKSKSEPNFYFSAYPLKALNLPATEKKTYLHIYRNKDGEIKAGGRVKIVPMALPKKETAVVKPIKKVDTDSVDHREADWFSNYE